MNEQSCRQHLQTLLTSRLPQHKEARQQGWHQPSPVLRHAYTAAIHGIRLLASYKQPIYAARLLMPVCWSPGWQCCNQDSTIHPGSYACEHLCLQYATASTVLLSCSTGQPATMLAMCWIPHTHQSTQHTAWTWADQTPSRPCGTEQDSPGGWPRWDPGLKCLGTCCCRAGQWLCSRTAIPLSGPRVQYLLPGLRSCHNQVCHI